MLEASAHEQSRTNYGVLRAILNWAVNTDIMDRSPCRGVRLPALTAVKKPVVSADDVLRLADAIAPDYRVTVFLGAMGLRQAEVFGLRVGSINFLRRTITVEATVNEVEGVMVGVPLEVIQRRLGHASIRTTADIYGTLPENVDRAVADQLDGLFRASRKERESETAGAGGSPAPSA